jgi:hypothetical protein
MHQRSLKRRTRIGLFLLTLIAFGASWMWWLEERVDRGVVGGIVRLELVGGAQGADELKIDPEALDPALWADFVLIVAYSVVLVAAVRLLFPLFRVSTLRGKYLDSATLVALVPGFLDALENLMLFRAVSGTGGESEISSGWLLAATVCAVAKFLVLFVIILILLVALVAGLSTPQWLYDRLDEGLRTGSDEASPSQLGIAISGGGVRAASLALGTLQELERGSNLGWHDADRVTSVSGGSYMAGAWHLSRQPTLSTAPADPAEGGVVSRSVGVEGEGDSWALRGDGSKPGPEERHLLANLGYLTSTWSRGRHGDVGAPTEALRGIQGEDAAAQRRLNRASVWATIFAGFIANLVVFTAVIAIVVIPIGLLLDWLAGLGGTCAERWENDPGQTCLAMQPRMLAPPLAWLAIGVLASLAWVVVGHIGFLRSRVRLLRALKALTRGGLILGLVLGLLLVVFPLLVGLVDSMRWAWAGATLGALGSLGSAGQIFRKPLAALAPKIGGLAFMLLLLASSAGIANWVVDQDPASSDVTIVDAAPDRTVGLMLLCSLLVVLVFWSLVSPEIWSMSGFYRGRLRQAYALRRETSDLAIPYLNDADAQAEGGAGQEPALSKVVGSPLTICAAAHASTRAVKTHHQVPALSLTMSSKTIALHVPQDDLGGGSRHACRTEDMEKALPRLGFGASRRLTTMFAVGLSGAAVSPAMGRWRIGPTSMLLAFANVRLGAWLPNPGYVDCHEQSRFPLVRIGYLLKEFVGWHDPSDAFVYVSDGGHWENCGLAELVRTGVPAEVVCIDADPGAVQNVRQLAQAIDMAKLECDVDILVDFEPLRGHVEPSGTPVFSQRSVTVGIIRTQRENNAGTTNRDWALIWYTKCALTRASPAPLLAHREIDPKFPTTSTVDQFFDTATYTAYRDLGRHNARELKLGRQRLVACLKEHDTVESFLAADTDGESWAVQAIYHLLHVERDADMRTEMFMGVKAALRRAREDSMSANSPTAV